MFLRSAISKFAIRAMEVAASSVARRAQSVVAEKRGIEIRPGLGIRIQLQAARENIGFIDAIVIDAVRLGADQRVVAVVDQRYREAGAETRDAGKFPSLVQRLDARKASANGSR